MKQLLGQTVLLAAMLGGMVIVTRDTEPVPTRIDIPVSIEFTDDQAATVTTEPATQWKGTRALSGCDTATGGCDR